MGIFGSASVLRRFIEGPSGGPHASATAALSTSEVTFSDITPNETQVHPARPSMIASKPEPLGLSSRLSYLSLHLASHCSSLIPDSPFAGRLVFEDASTQDVSILVWFE